jgi:IS605 OrfB family transposase
MKKKHSLVLEKLPEFLALNLKRFVKWLIQKKSDALKHLPDKENLIYLICKRCLITILLIVKMKKIQKITTYIQGSPQKNNWTTFLDKMSLSETTVLNTLHILLFQILLQELISKEKELKPFWNPACKELSEKLLLPIKTDYPVLDTTFSNLSLKKVEEKSQLLTVTKINLQNRNSQKTFYQSSTSLVADKWVKENTKETITRTIKIPLKLTIIQRKTIDEWINTVRYVYNKTIYEINTNKHKINFETLRNKLITEKTTTNSELYKEISNLYSKKNLIKKQLKNVKKTDPIYINLQEQITELDNIIKEKEINKKNIKREKNQNIKEWELNTPTHIRAGAIRDIIDAYDKAFTNLKAGNIRHFKIGYKKKTELNKCIVIPQNIIKNNKGKLQIAKQFLKKECDFKMGKRNIKKYENLEIRNDCRLVKQNNEYWILIPLKEKITKPKKANNYCGVDPGVRTFLTTFGNNGCYEYEHKKELLDKLNTKLDTLKNKRTKKSIEFKKQIHKNALLKIEKRKSNLIEELHWKTINDLLTKNDIIYYGDIKSHDIVSNEKNHNKKLKRDFNDLKFYQFKKKLQYKATQNNKLVLMVKEHYTTKTCSCCGNIRNVGISKTYECLNCKSIFGRDINASKNILIKGIILHN